MGKAHEYGGSDARSDERFMCEALAEARRAAQLGEVPIGAVVVQGGRVIARAHNRRELDEDPSAHAEFSAMLEASRVLGRWRLSGCTVYVTLEPCIMCAGLMVNARIDRCVFGAFDPKGGALGTLFDMSDDARLNHRFSVTSGVLEAECAHELRTFFRSLRDGDESGASSLCSGGAHHRDVDLGIMASHSVRVGSEPTHFDSRNVQVLLALDSFKGSATSSQAAAWLAAGVRRSLPQAHIKALPLADGGEGTIEALHACLGGELRTAEVTGPFGEPCTASYLMGGSGPVGPWAVIETAQVAGIGFSARTHAAACTAGTRGVGELMLKAVAQGAKTLYIGLGGSATTDGGVGALQALGAYIYDARGCEVGPGLSGVADVAGADLSEALHALVGVHIVACSDVGNPLVGPRGAVRVFGLQKGLGESAVEAERRALYATCDRWMTAYGACLTAARDALDGTSLQVGAHGARPKSLAGVPGAGAAGGLGAALLAIGAELVSGVDVVLDLCGFDAALRGACAVVTGEGSIDAQTAEGKVPAGVARRVKRLRPDVPVLAVCASRAADLDAVYRKGVDVVLPIMGGPQSLSAALDPVQTKANLAMAGETVGRMISLGIATGV